MQWVRVNHLAVRTVFNLLGPLCNPAGVDRQLMGIFDGGLTDKIIKVLKKLGSKRAMVVYGKDGLDEISTTDKTIFTELTMDGDIKSGVIDPEKYSIPICRLSSLKGGSPDQNAKIMLKIFHGEQGPHREIVVLNAAAGILIGGKVNNLSDGIEIAKDSIDSGATLKVLNLLASIR